MTNDDRTRALTLFRTLPAGEREAMIFDALLSLTVRLDALESSVRPMLDDLKARYFKDGRFKIPSIWG